MREFQLTVSPVAVKIYRNWKEYGFQAAPLARLYLMGVAANTDDGFDGVETPEQLLKKYPINAILSNARDFYPTYEELIEHKELEPGRAEKFCIASLFSGYLTDTIIEEQRVA